MNGQVHSLTLSGEVQTLNGELREPVGAVCSDESVELLAEKLIDLCTIRKVSLFTHGGTLGDAC